MRKTSTAMLAACALLPIFAAAAAAQSANEDTRRAEALDSALGATADLPKPPAAAAPRLAWPEPPLPPWLAGQPYRQQPLLTGVPRGGAVGGRVRGSTP